MKRILIAGALSGLIALMLPAPGCRAGAPGEYVRRMLDAVMAIQSDPKLQGTAFREERSRRIAEIISKNFDLKNMAQQTLDGVWHDLNAGQRSEFTEIFRDLFQNSYTKLVLDFLKEEKIGYDREQIHSGAAEVKTTILRPNEHIPVDYSLAACGDTWIVDDVRIDGVSIVENYKRTFARVIRKESYKVLIEKMRLQQEAIREG